MAMPVEELACGGRGSHAHSHTRAPTRKARRSSDDGHLTFSRDHSEASHRDEARVSRNTSATTRQSVPRPEFHSHSTQQRYGVEHGERRRAPQATHETSNGNECDTWDTKPVKVHAVPPLPLPPATRQIPRRNCHATGQHQVTRRHAHLRHHLQRLEEPFGVVVEARHRHQATSTHRLKLAHGYRARLCAHGVVWCATTDVQRLHKQMQ